MTFAPRLVALVAGALLALPVLAHAVDVTGTVELLERGKPLRTTEVANAVVWFSPRPAVAPKPLPDAQMLTERKEFKPKVLPVTRGTRVLFPNADPILHNVFSVSGGNRFDLGLYRKGPGKSWTFTEPGVVRVFCNVHHSMVGYVVVLDTPFFASVDAQGRFRLAGVPGGPGTLTVWHDRGEPTTQEITAATATPPVAARIVITKPRVPSHLDKLGKPYARDNAYR